MVVAGLTPSEWDVTIIDENRGIPNYDEMPPPDLVGITSFTSQANRAYEIAAYFRGLDVKVVMGGVHATMCLEEALEHVDVVVTGEAESGWGDVVRDAQTGDLNRVYSGSAQQMGGVPPPRHDLLSEGYGSGSIQTARGCPLNCTFCSVTAFNGGLYRHRPIDEVVEEFKLIREKWVLIVDDNLIGTRDDHIARAKKLFRAMIDAGIKKNWVAQVTINIADDEELLSLAAKAGCLAVFVGFESPNEAGLKEINKRFNLQKGRDFKESIRKIHRHGILVTGSFIMGLNSDEPGIGLEIAKSASRYGVDLLNALILTPLPGTKLWEKMVSENRIAANSFPQDWKHYTLTFPVASFNNFSWSEIVAEVESCNRAFFKYSRIVRRLIRPLWRLPKIASIILNIATNFGCRNNGVRNFHKRFEGVDMSRGDIVRTVELTPPTPTAASSNLPVEKAPE